MTTEEFWIKVDLILSSTRNRPDSNHTQEEEETACGDFLIDVDLLASEWYNRED
jgi:hypothetical protein